MDTITITEYELKHQPFFEKFNRRWIEKYFEMEELDEFMLTYPEEAILIPGGAILMALCNGTVAGTVALRKVDNTTYEFTKMAVDEKFQRKGIAQALSQASFKKAEELGAREVILYTNSILKPAIALYEKLGFKHVQSGFKEYKRSDVKMTITITKAETVTS
jgi:ribosomal protein S18 acetylase RimI-like enzyme